MTVLRMESLSSGMPAGVSMAIMRAMRPEHRDPHPDETAAAVAATLRGIPLFNGCEPSEITTASRLLRERVDVAGTRFEPADVASHSFFVTRGQLITADDAGASFRLSFGDLFGLLGFPFDPRTTAIVALTTVRTLVADEEASARLLSLDGIARALVYGTARRRRAQLRPAAAEAAPWA